MPHTPSSLRLLAHPFNLIRTRRPRQRPAASHKKEQQNQPEITDELAVFAGKKIERPAMFLSGKQDWGVYQTPGGLERMKNELCVRMDDEDIVLVEGAGHWVQQEQPEEVVKYIERFLKKVAVKLTTLRTLLTHVYLIGCCVRPL